jgi:hypothetical protein
MTEEQQEMWDRILTTSCYCIMCEGPMVTDVEWAIMYDVAQQLLEKEENSTRIKWKSGEGAISTNFEIANLGGMSGFVFEAVLDTTRGTLKIVYLVKRLANWENTTYTDLVFDRNILPPLQRRSAK